MPSYDKSKFTEIQKREYATLSEGQKELVKKGYLVKIVSLETEKEICSFNEDIYEMPEGALESLARAVLPDIIKYYEDKRNSSENDLQEN